MSSERERLLHRAVALGVAVALGAGCSSESPRPALPPPVPAAAAGGAAATAPASSASASVAAAPKEADPEIRWRLEKDAVHDCCVARKTLWTWTTREQIDELRKSKVLLSRGESPTKGLSRFDRQLEARSDPASRLLRQPGLSRRRFAWSNPWATLLGWGEAERYGEELVRVTIRDHARVGIFDGSLDAPWRFVETDNTPVPLDQALAQPERIAVVYHVYRPKPGEAGALAYREFVLVNEAMIQQWTYGTGDVTGRLVEDVATFAKLRDALRDGLVAPGTEGEVEFSQRVAGTIWPQAVDRPTVPFAFAAGLAMPNRAYLLTAAGIDGLVSALQRALPKRESLSHYPNVVFDLRSSAPPKAPPPPKPFRRGGFGSF